MHREVYRGRLTLLVGCLFLVGLLLPVNARGDDKPSSVEEEVIPADAVMVWTVNLAHIWDGDLTRPLRDKLSKEIADLGQVVEKDLGVVPEDVERLTFVELGPGRSVVVVTARNAYHRRRLAVPAKPFKEEEYRGKTLLVNDPEGPAVALLNVRTFVLAPARTLKQLLDRAGKPAPGSLTPALREVANKHAAVLGVNAAAVAREGRYYVPPGAAREAKFQPLLAAEEALAVLDLDDGVKLRVRAKFADEAAAMKGEKALRAAVERCREELKEVPEELRKVKFVKRLLDLADGSLKGVTVKRDGAALGGEMQAKPDLESMIPDLRERLPIIRQAINRNGSRDNLRWIGIALHEYYHDHKRYVPPAVYDKAGKPLLSWRVLLLPYLKEEALYKEFRLDEPWDSEHNKKLLDKMPAVYAAPGLPPSHRSHYRGFAGKGSVLEPKQGATIADIPDGTPNTIIFVEAPEGVEWTKPEELPFDLDKPLPKLGGLFPGGFNSLWVDGHVSFIPDTVSEKWRRLAIGRNDRQELPPEVDY
jgi:prepilin-type processing-associated H-X9-DG protein